MKKTLSYFLYTMLIACIVCACNDRLDITQKYAFDWVAMPYPKKVVQNETVEIRLRIVKSGDYAETKFYIRYFQTDGKVVFRPLSLIRKKHSRQGYNKRLKKNFHLSSSIFLPPLPNTAVTLCCCAPTHSTTLR